MTDSVALRERYRAGKTALFSSLAASRASTQGILSLLRKLAGLTDSTLQSLWQASDFPPSACLVAVGGFGRGELFPHSDVDVLLLLPDDVKIENDPALRSKVESFISNCWDCGLEIGSSVRTAADCAQEAVKDVTVQTSLLEARLVAGSEASFVRLQASLEAVLDPKAFFVAKTLE